MSRPSRRASQGRAQKRLTALKEELQGRSTLDLAATTFTPQTLEAHLQSRIRLVAWVRLFSGRGIGARSIP